MANIPFSFIYTTQAKYDAKVSDGSILTGGIYFISDTHRIYRGAELMSSANVLTLSTAPTIEEAIENVLYLVGSGTNYEIYSKVGSSVIKVGGVPENLDLSVFAEGVIAETIDDNNSASKTSIPTVGAVAGYVTGIQSAIYQEIKEYDSAIKDVTVKETSETDSSKFSLVFEKVDGTTKTIDLQKEAFAESAVLRNDEANGKKYLDITVVNGDVISVDLTELIDIADASTVKTTNKITLTTDWGNLKAGDEIDASTSIQDLLIDALSKDIYPTATNPKITSISLTGAGTVEVGTEFTPTYTVNLSSPFGSYSVTTGSQSAVASGCSVSKYNVTDSNGNTATTKTGSFTKFTVDEETNYSVSATVDYTQGNMPMTFLGNEHESVRISAGTTDKVTSSALKGERFIFYGTKTTANAIAKGSTLSTMTSAQVRSLGKSNKKSSGFPTSITLPTDCQEVFFACPTGADTVSAVLNSANQAPFGTVKKLTGISVEGLNSFESTTYDVYYISNAGGTSGSATFTVKA